MNVCVTGPPDEHMSAFADAHCVAATASDRDAGGKIISKVCSSTGKSARTRPYTISPNALEKRQSPRHSPQKVNPGICTRSMCTPKLKGHTDQIPIYQRVHSLFCNSGICSLFNSDVRCIRAGCPQPLAKHSAVELQVCAARGFDPDADNLKLYCSFSSCADKSANPSLTQRCTPSEWDQLHTQSNMASPHKQKHVDKAAYLQANPGVPVLVKHGKQRCLGETLPSENLRTSSATSRTHHIFRIKDDPISSITLLPKADLKRSSTVDKWNGYQTTFAGQRVLGEVITKTCTLPFNSFVLVKFQWNGIQLKCWKHVSYVSPSQLEDHKTFDEQYDANQLQLAPNGKMRKSESSETLWIFKKGVPIHINKTEGTSSTANRPSNIHNPSPIFERSSQATRARVKSLALALPGKNLLNAGLRVCWLDKWYTGYVHSYKCTSNTYECVFPNNTQVTHWQVTLKSAAVVEAIKAFDCYDEPTLGRLGVSASTPLTQKLVRLQRMPKMRTMFSISRRSSMSKADLGVSKQAAAAPGEPEHSNSHGTPLADLPSSAGTSHTQLPCRSLRKPEKRTPFSIRGRSTMTEAHDSVSKLSSKKARVIGFSH